MTGERKQTPYINRLRDVVMLQATRIYMILDIGNIETIRSAAVADALP
jgi:hypothetical protein